METGRIKAVFVMRWFWGDGPAPFGGLFGGLAMVGRAWGEEGEILVYWGGGGVGGIDAWAIE